MLRSFPIPILPLLKGVTLKRGAIFGGILISALLAFEVFNFGTTAFALRDVLGELTFAGMRWATILAFAFCGIDFAGIARIFTPEQGRDEPAEVYYLFGAWLLAASFNAMLTWWGVSVAILNHNAVGGALVSQSTLTKVVPILVAIMVWLIRLLLIGTFSIAGDRLFSQVDDRVPYRNQASYTPLARTSDLPQSSQPRPAPKPVPSYGTALRNEPTYHPVGMAAMTRNNNNSSVRR